MWGIVPAAGRGSRIQPLAFSKELLPVGSRREEGTERPCAVSEYLLERLILGGADKICFVISPGKSDILEYFGDHHGSAELAYVVQPDASGLCDAVFRAGTVVGNDEDIVVGLPDTVWFPKAALQAPPDSDLSFLLFPSSARNSSTPSCSMARACARSRSRSRCPPYDGSGAHSGCRPAASANCTRSGTHAIGATNISARWSIPISRRVASASGSRPVNPMSMSVPSTAFALRWHSLRKAPAAMDDRDCGPAPRMARARCRR